MGCLGIANDLSLWEYAAAMDGWNRAQGGEEEAPDLTSADFDEMLERHSEWMATMH